MPAKKKPAAPKQASLNMDLGLPRTAGIMTALNPVAMKVCMDSMSETARFITKRANAAAAFGHEAMTCRTPGDLMELQASYVKSTMEDYAVEMNRCLTLMAAATRMMSKDVTEGHRRDYDDVPV